MKIEFVFTSASKVVDKKGVIEQDGFNSFHLVPVTDKGSFDTKFDELYAIKNDAVQQQLTLISQEADDIKSQVLNMSTNLSENYLSKVELEDPAVLGIIASGIKESTATFVTTEQAGQWYGLELVTDVNGKKYVTGFDIGALVYPESGSADSYFRINADRFIVGGDLGDGAFSTMVDANGEPIPAFAIVQDGTGPAQMYFNGKVNISSVPTVFNKMIGKFASKVLLDVHLAENPDVVVTDGDTWLDTTRNIVYSWDGDEWISTGDVVKFKSTVFIRAEVKPSAPSGGMYDSPLPTSMPMWSDGVPDGTGPLWMSTATFDNKTDYTTNPIIWGDVSPLALSESVRFLFSDSLTQPTGPGAWVDDGDGTYSDSTGNWVTPMEDPVWMAISEAKIVGGNVQWGPWVVSKVKGEDGTDGEQGPSGADGIRGSVVATVESTIAPTATALTNAIYAKVSPDSLVSGDTVIWINTTSSGGTDIYQYNGTMWGTNTALRINGNAIIDGTLFVSGDSVTGGTIVGSAIQVAGGNSWGTNGVMYISKIEAVGNVYSTGHINTATLNVRSTLTATGGYTEARYVNTGGHGGGGAGNAYGISTGTYKAYIGGGVLPFTGVHFGYSKDLTLEPGDIVSSDDAWVVDVAQTLVHVSKSTEVDTRVFGVVNTTSSDVLANIRNNYSVADEIKDMVIVPAKYSDDGILVEDERVEYVPTGQWVIKPQFQPYIDKLINEAYVEVNVNALGEGGINVCSVNGNILNGDYITSSSLQGKGMKQNDDILHSYTVAKALESVVWDNEVVGERGCFEQDGYKCKMIACTYHCG